MVNVNENVQVGKLLRICARGLTPNHTFFKAGVNVDGISGRLIDFTHVDGVTHIVLLTPDGGTVVVRKDYMDVIEVTTP